MKIVVFKVVFAYLGLQLAGFLELNPLSGLGVGVLVGHVLDMIASQRLLQWRIGRYQKQQAEVVFQRDFIGSLFFMMGKICGVDGAIDEREIAEVERVIKEALKLSRKDKAKAVEAFRSARRSNTSFQGMAVKFFELYQSHPQMLEGTLQMFLRLATVDGALSEEEDQLIQVAATVFGLEPKRYNQLRSGFVAATTNGSGPMPFLDLKRSYAVLGCDPNDADAAIKKNYRKLVSEFHPDKIHSKELPAEFMDFANQKMKEIQQAYELVKSERGFS